MPNPEEILTTHKRETRRGVWMPVHLATLGLVVFVGVVVAVLALAERGPSVRQLGIVADLLAVLFILLPMVLCLFPLYMAIVIAAAGLGAVHKGSARQLGRLNNLSRNITDRTISVTDTINRRSIPIGAAFAPLENFWTKDNDDDGTTRTTNE